MANRPRDLHIAEKIALTLIGSEIKKKFAKAEIPKGSLSRLTEALNFAYREAIKAYNDNPSIDFSTAIYIQLRTYLKLKSKREGPLFFFVPEEVRFKQEKKLEAIKVLLIQPKAPSIDHFNQKNTSLGKLFVIRSEHTEEIKETLHQCLNIMQKVKADFVCLPELCFVNDEEVKKEFIKTASQCDSFIIAGSFHDDKEEANVCLIFCPNGQIIKQRKLYRSKELGEGIKTREEELLHIFDYGQGRFCVLICIDSEAEAIRDALKERLLRCRCPDLIFNPSFTKAKTRAHSQLGNLMSLIFAVIVFCNSGCVGGSCVLYPAISLKGGKFKKLELPMCTNKSIHKTVTIDISALQAYKQAKINCLISMKE